jgi:hypothetical protein
MRGDRPAWVGYLRRPLLVLAITLLCGAAYLFGIWTGMNTNVTCVTTAPGRIVCDSDGSKLPAPLPPTEPSQPTTGSA